MKRLLLICHAFPPAPSPGAQRPGYIARYIAQFGWQVTTLSATPGAPPFPARVVHAGPTSATLQERMRARLVDTHQNPNAPLRVALRAAKETLLFPDATAPWMPAAIRAGSAILRSEHFDAVLSSAHPPSVHVVAWILARRFRLPWVADYRDPWAGNAYLVRGPIRRRLEMLLERGMIHHAAAITTISEPIADQLRRFHRRNVVVIPNAYDPSEWDAIPERTPEHFDLCFTGSMYDGKRSPDVLFAALAEMRAAGEPAGSAARVHFYGPSSDNVTASAARFGLNLVVRQHGVVPRSSAMRAQRTAAALLIFLNTDPATANEMGSKYLEYIGARRPIVALGPPGSVMRGFIERSNGGWFASTIEQAKEAVRQAYQRFSAGAWDIRVDASLVPSARELAGDFARVLDTASVCVPIRSIA